MGFSMRFAGVLDIKVLGDTPLCEYLREEYKPYITSENGRTYDLVINTDTTDEAVPGKFYAVRQPVGYDHNVFLYDLRNRVFRLNLSGFGYRDYTVSCDRRFSPQFFSTIFEYLVSSLLVSRGIVFCHCSAFEYKGKVVLCPAWRNTGKTDMLLQFLRDGARYIADDWCLLREAGTIQSIPKRVNLLHYNLMKDPELMRRLPREKAILVDAIKKAEAGQLNLNVQVLEALKVDARVRLSPGDVFENCEVIEDPVSVDAVFMLKRSVMDETTQVVSPPEDAAATLLSTLEFEHAYFIQAYEVSKGLGGSPNEHLERVRDTASAIIEKFLGHVHRLQSVEIRHGDGESAAAIRSAMEW